MPHRPPATIAVVPGAAPARARGGLAALTAALGPHDNLVLLQGDAERNPRRWFVPRSGGLVHPDRLPSPREIVVVVDEQMVGSRDWLEELVACFLDPRVAGAAPFTNRATGEELFLGLPYRPTESAERDAFLASFAEGRAAALPVTHLAGPTLARRADVLAAHGGVSGLAAAPDRWREARSEEADGSLVVAARAFVHHPGGRAHSPAGPLVSACLIVKDEEANIGRCLASLDGAVDEIVVYDTGSADGTVELAEEAGAAVHAGYWDDDFSRARNAALAHCRGEWVLSIDADEALVAPDPGALRSFLAAAPTATEGFLVTIDNLRGTDTATVLSHPACRLFRRAAGHWDGRIHEQVVARAGSRDLSLAAIDLCRLTHWGYVQAALAGRDKGARNVRTAFGDLAGGSELDPGERLTSLGRSYLMASRLEEGIEITRRAVSAAAGRPSTERLARRALIEGLLALGAFEEALEECAALASMQQVPTIANAHAGAALLALERHEEALVAFESVRAGTDDDGFDYDPSFVAAPKAECLAALGRHGAAADVLLGCLREQGGIDAHLGLLVECLSEAERPLGEVADAIPEGRSRAFVPQLLQLQPDAADRVLEAWIERRPDDLAVLAAAGRLGPRLPVARQLAWSTRLRAHGLGGSCPLVLGAAESGLDPATRALGAAVAQLAFGDETAAMAFVASVLGTPLAAREELLAALGQLDGGVAALAARLLPTAAAPCDLPSGGNGRRSVLLVSERAPAPSAYALARELRVHGHAVTLVQPQPAAPAEALLAPHQVRVHGFATDGAGPGLLALAAQLTATAAYDTVVLAGTRETTVTGLRALAPLAALLSFEQEAASSFLRPLAVEHQPPRWLLGEPHWEELFGEPLTTPSEARHGLLVLGEAPAERELATALLEAVAAEVEMPIALLGDRDLGELATALPEVLRLGPLADPLPWLRAARATLVFPGTEVTAWRALAAHAATPAVEVALRRGAEELCEQLAAALGGGAATAATRVTGSADPLGPLGPPEPRRVHRHGSTVVLRGGVFGHDSLSTVNRELLVALRERGTAVSALTAEEPTAAEGRRLSDIALHRELPRGDVALEIRHAFPPLFTPTPHPLVLIQPWEFGCLPAEWVGPLRDVVDELWVPTHYVRQAAIDSGVDPAQVVVVPNGVDPRTFSPEGPRRALRTGKSLKLLFVGGLIERKGVDALLETYCSTFTAVDDVCLVLKPFGSATVYRDSTLEGDVRRLASGGGPEIEFVDDDLTAAEMAALYRACDVLVHPYRGEGFGMPIAEAMACGLPVVVPDDGACLDFCDEEVAWMIPTRRVPIRPSEWTPVAGGSWWLEPSRDGLAAALREACADQAGRERRGRAGAERIAAQFTWSHAAEIAAGRIAALLSAAERRGHEQGRAA